MGSQEVPLVVTLRASCCAELCEGVAMGGFSSGISGRPRKACALGDYGRSPWLAKGCPRRPLATLEQERSLGPGPPTSRTDTHAHCLIRDPRDRISAQ